MGLFLFESRAYDVRIDRDPLVSISLDTRHGLPIVAENRDAQDALAKAFADYARERCAA